MQKILKKIRKADDDFQLIEEGDMVMVGVSGGKDSMLLLKALVTYQKFDHKQFQLIAVHMNMGFPNNQTQVIRNYCDSLKIPYHEEIVPIYEILNYHKKKDGTLDCSRCSNLKRGAIVNVAKLFKANKIAFAHHGDDAIETYFLNTIYSGKIATFAPKIDYEDNALSFIRPLVYVYENEIINTMKKEQIPSIESNCPKDGQSKRQQVKELVQYINTTFPSAQHNFLKMLNHNEINLWKKNTDL